MLLLTVVGVFSFCVGGTVGMFVTALIKIASDSDDILLGEDQYRE